MRDRAVLVTGASTGIGRACALHLDGRGFRVFAGVRKQDDGEKLQADASGRLAAVILDVTDPSSIDTAAGKLTAETGDELFGLVNNAGVTYQGPLEYLSVDDLRAQFEVNVLGQMAVAQRFLPSIRRARGRIVFMSSIGGRVRSIPLLGPYTASKHAIEALAESLRLELMPWGIHVAIVEPGNIATPIWDKGDSALEKLIESLPDEARDRYGKALARGRRISVAAGKRGIAPQKVAEKIAHALESKRPKTRYLVGADAQFRARAEAAIPDALRDKLLARVMGYGKD